MRFHVLAVPHTVTSIEYVACAFTQKVLKFAKMMSDLGHTIIHYGNEDSVVQCTEHVTVITKNDLAIAYGEYNWKKNFFKHDINDFAYKTFIKNTIIEVGKRKQKNDFILAFFGHAHRSICDAHSDMIVVEPGIGYPDDHFAKYKIFESYAILHAFYGMDAVRTCRNNFYDVVIPNYFDPSDFTFKGKDEKEDYFLFIGRISQAKGIHIAIQVTKEIGAKLKVAGQNNLAACGYDVIPDHVEFIGYADLETRRDLMSKAKCTIVASMYNEPFGGVQIESLLSGTPTITTDWGAFTENNVNGLTGYRCKTFEEFCWAARNIDAIKPEDCRAFALARFSMERVGKMYEEYFQSLLNIYTGKGWYEPNPTRSGLISTIF